MAQTLRKKFKKLMKSRKLKIRDICIITSEYLKTRFIDISPLELQEISGQKDLYHNFFLARAYYGKKWNIDLPGMAKKLPENPKDGSFVTKTDYTVHRYQKENDIWVPITEPLEPGHTKVFEYETEHKEEVSEEK